MMLRSLTLLFVFALALPVAGGAQGLTFRDDLGQPVPGLEVCFQVDGDRRCRSVAPEGAVRWPARASGLWAAGPEHGPLWVDRESVERGETSEIVVPRKAWLRVDGAPAGTDLAVYRAGDRAFDVPLDRLRVLHAGRAVRVPSGETVVAISDAGTAPDLHRLSLEPGSSGDVTYTPRAGWSAVVRTRSPIRGRPIPGVAVRWIGATLTSPRSARSELAAQVSDGEGLALLSGLEAPVASVETTHERLAPRTVHGLIAPPGGLLYQEIDLRPGGTVVAKLLWRGEPAAEVRVSLVAEPTDPSRKVQPSEVFHRGRTGADGRLRLEHVPEGRYLLRVSAPDGAAVDAGSHADLTLEVADRRTTEIAADLHPRSIEGRVLRGGVGASGYRLHARVLQVHDEGEERSLSISRTAAGQAYTDDAGAYRIEVLADGLYLVALHTLDGTAVAARAVRVEGAAAVADFALAAEALEGRVVGSRGGGVEDAEVAVRWGSSAAIQTARTRVDGGFSIPYESDRLGLSPVIATARKDGWTAVRREVGIGGPTEDDPETAEGDERGEEGRPPAEPEDIELTLHRLERVRGRVVDGDGRPIPDAWVGAARDAAGSPLHFVGESRTDGRGVFEVPNGVVLGAPPPRRAPVRVYVSAPGCYLTETLVEPYDPPGGRLDEADHAPPVILTCNRPAALLRAHVAFSASHPLPGERVTLRRNGRVIPVQILDGHLRNLRLPRATAEDGSLLLVLEPGRWEIYRAADTSATAIGAGDESGLLGKVALDPWTVTDLYTGAGADE